MSQSYVVAKSFDVGDVFFDRETNTIDVVISKVPFDDGDYLRFLVIRTDSTYRPFVYSINAEEFAACWRGESGWKRL